jgi:hypothetical protein
MFFIISKIVGFITTPTNVAVALVVFGLAVSSTGFAALRGASHNRSGVSCGLRLPTALRSSRFFT